MSTKYTVMFTAGGRLDGAKISTTELAAMHDYIESFLQRFPTAIIYEKLGMATVELTEAELASLEFDPNIYYTYPLKTYKRSSVVQQNVPWHLASISNSAYGTYEYSTTGIGIPAYVVDSGIATEHPEFEGRAIKGFFIEEPVDPHGTHVAGIIGSKTYGVAKQCQLISVQVFDSKYPDLGAIWLLDGLNWILDNHAQDAPGVVNLSLGGPSDVSDAPARDAILALIAEGLLVVVSAGNDGIDAGTTFPANMPTVITVGAIDVDKKVATFSNFGSVVDIMAPGVDILSTVLSLSADLLSGTSMAAPVVAGICARYLSMCKPVLQSHMQTRLVQYGVADVVSSSIKRAIVNIPGIKLAYKTELSEYLNGQFRQYYYSGASKVYEGDYAFGEAKRIPVLCRFSLDGSMTLPAEITKTTLPDIQPPIVVPPLVLPPPIAYDGGFIEFRPDFSILFKGTVYQPTSHIQG